VAGGAALRVIGIRRNLWVDEIATVTSYLRLPPWRTLYSYHSLNQHLLYSFLGSVSLRTFGESEWSARLLAALFGVTGLVAPYYLVRVWVLYSFPRDMPLRFPDLYDYIRSHARIVTTSPGTVGDGAIYVARLDGA
jgi:hypothetical protein